MSDDKRVIDLDSHRDAEKQEEIKAKDMKKWLASSALLLLLCAAALTNYQIFQAKTDTSVGPRGLASSESTNSTDHDWNTWLRNHNQSSDRQPTNIGQQPSSIDLLVVKWLEGKYRVVFKKEGVIESIEFVDRGQRPKYVRNRPEFLIQNSKAFTSEGFSKVRLVEDSLTSDGLVEVYSLKNKANQSKGRVRVSMDEYGRLMSLSVE